MSKEIEVMTVKEIAGLLRVDVKTIYRKAELGQIPGTFRLGSAGTYRFVKADVINWIKDQVKG